MEAGKVEREKRDAYEFPNGRTYEGQWLKGSHTIDGIGKLQTPEGEVYEGEFKYNVRAGKGV